MAISSMINTFGKCPCSLIECHSDRVRAIALAMGFTPIIWTGVGGSNFDTGDWHIVSICLGTAPRRSSHGNYFRHRPEARFLRLVSSPRSLRFSIRPQPSPPVSSSSHMTCISSLSTWLSATSCPMQSLVPTQSSTLRALSVVCICLLGMRTYLFLLPKTHGFNFSSLDSYIETNNNSTNTPPNAVNATVAGTATTTATTGTQTKTGAATQLGVSVVGLVGGITVLVLGALF